MGQGHLEGIKSVINHLLKSGFNKVMCLNMREEPSIYYLFIYLLLLYSGICKW